MLIAALVFFAFDSRVGAAAVDAAEYYCQNVCLQAMNGAVQKSLTENEALLKDLVEIRCSDRGYVQQIETNTENVNLLRLRMTDEVMHALETLRDEEVTLRLGSLTGLSLLFGRGPAVRMRVIPLTAVESEVCESFEGAGVNQTVHTLSLQLTAKMRVLYGVRAGTVTVETEVVLSQSLVSGQVPGWYSIK